MKNPLSHLFSRRENHFSYFWFRIVQTRLALCVILVASSFFLPEMSKPTVFSAIIIYIAINLCLGFVRQTTLLQKRIRIIPAIIDVVFISFLIYYSGGQISPWFVLYVFPIASVSRYLSYEGSVPLAMFSIIGYVFAASIPEQNIDFYQLTLKSLLLLAIGFVLGNITKTKGHEEDALIEIFKEIGEIIIENPDINDVLKLILEKAITFTKSDFGQLKLLNNEGEIIDTISLSQTVDADKEFSAIQSIVDKYSEKVRVSKKSTYVRLTKAKQGNANGKSADESGREYSNLITITLPKKTENISGFALFVPLIINEDVKGIITLITNDPLHYYSKKDATVLGNLAPLLGIALKDSELYQEIKKSDKENKERLKMLFDIGEQLTVDKDLTDIFQKVVELTYNRLNSEESALFIWDEKAEHLHKVSVQGPSKEIISKLKKLEKSYKKGQSLVGKIFEAKEPQFLNHIGREVEHKDEYSEVLPSKNAQHYIGVPLIIGNQVLGVLRVINKKSPDYSVENEQFTLSAKGFSEEDFELMKTLASQIASAVRSANFIEVKRKYEVLIENSPDPIIVLDKEGRIEVFNKACETIWGFKADEVKGKSVETYYESREHARKVGKMLRDKKKENKRLENYEAQIKDYEGEIIPISLSASLLFDDQGKKIGSIGVFKDLRETQRLQEEKNIDAKLASLGKLAHTVGHEIKHDIATALNYIDVLAFETDDEELLEIYRDIQESLNEAVEKFQNMLMVGKPKPPQKQLIGSSDIFQLVEEKMKRRAKSENVEFIITYPESDDDLMADIEQLNQVLMNLFNNSMDAVKANKQSGKLVGKGKIEITGCTENGYLEIIFKDNGCGIPLENQPNVFLPFVTFKDTGNGLGLYNVKSIVENHGGLINLQSEQGEGVTFTILLPLYKEDSM